MYKSLLSREEVMGSNPVKLDTDETFPFISRVHYLVPRWVYSWKVQLAL